MAENENNNNNDPDIPASCDAARPPSQVGYVKAFVTQSDWSGPVTQETWQGHHAPCCRIYVFLWMSCFASSWATLFSFMRLSSPDLHIPLLLPRGPNEAQFLEHLRTSHSACLEALCEQVGTLPLHCVVEQNGQAHVEWDGDDDQVHGEELKRYELHPHDKHWRSIPVPEACHVATEVTLGSRLLEGQALLTIKLQDQTSTNNKTHSHLLVEPMETLLTVLPSCELWINAEAILPTAWAAHFYGEEEEINVHNHHDATTDDNHQHNQPRLPPSGPQIAIALPLLIQRDAEENGKDSDYPPGHVERNILQQWLCPAHMAEPIQEDLLPLLQEFYRVFLDYRHEMITSSVLFYYNGIQIVRFVSCVVILLVTTLVVRCILPWPSSLGFLQTWQMLVLLSVLAMEPLLPLHPNDDEFLALLVPGTLAVASAVLYRDMQAAIEWLWLAVLGWGAHSVIFPWLDVVIFSHWYNGFHQDLLDKMDGLHILKILYTVSGTLVVGDEWWKLVTLYVWIRAYWPIYKYMKRQKQQRLEAQEHLLRAYQMQQQQQQQPPDQQQQQQPVVPAHGNPVNRALQETQMNLKGNGGTPTQDDPRHLKTE